MLMDLIKQAQAGKRVLIAGEDCGCLGDLSQYEGIETLTIIPKPVSDIRPLIAQSKCIAGLFEGTITLEAWSMGKATIVYDLKGKVTKKYPKPPAKAREHDVRKVADRLLDLWTMIWADLIIPHHNRKDLLAQLLESIPPLNYNVIVESNGYFSENCNKGARKAVTDQLFFVNDDMILNAQALWQMVDDPADVVGCRCIYPDGSPQYLGIGLRFNPVAKTIEYFMAADQESAHFPSGGFFKIKKALFWDAGRPLYTGFDEAYLNGGEDQDIFLCCYEKGAEISFCEIPVIHFLSQSKRRFDFVEINEKLYRDRWLDNRERLKAIFDIPELSA
jgi:hypothetical protein